MTLTKNEKVELLKFSPLEWNKWKELQPTKNALKLDLKGVNLKDLDLRGANLSFCDLSHTDLTGSLLESVNFDFSSLANANLSGLRLEDCSFKRTYLSYTNFEGCHLKSTTFKSVICKHGIFDMAAFRHCHFINGDFSKASFIRSCFEETTFSSVDLSYANFTYSKIENADFRYSHIDHTTVGLHKAPQGDLIVYKKVWDMNTRSWYILELLIPKEAKRSCSTSRKHRAEYVKVLRNVTNESVTVIAHASEYGGTNYVVGQITKPNSFDDNWKNECSYGIHFFLTESEATKWPC